WCAGPPRRLLRSTAGHALSRPGAWRGDPPRADAPAGRRREPSRHRPGPARADGGQRHRLVPDSRGRPSGSRTARRARLLAPAPACASRGGARGAARLAVLGALDLRDLRRLLVGGPDRCGIHAGLDRCRQPAADLRLPVEPRGSAPDPVDTSQAELRDGAGAVPASTVARGGAALGVVLSEAEPGAGLSSAPGRARIHDAEVRGVARDPSAPVAAGTVA